VEGASPTQVSIAILSMTTAFTLLILNLPSVACVVGTIILASRGIAGWGWLLFVAIITNPIIGGAEIKF